MILMSTEIVQKASFEKIRYAQLWEDGAILCDAIGQRDGAVFVSIGSAGDNALSMLTLNPSRVIAVDLSKAQLAAIKLRLSAWRVLSYDELLELIGSRDSNRRNQLLDMVLKDCDPETANFWDSLRIDVVKYGVGGVGKFENYFRLFREYILPIAHSKKDIQALFAPSDKNDRQEFLNDVWNNWRWNSLLKLFFSRTVMGMLGRDPAFFDHVNGSVSDHIKKRIRHAIVDNDPAMNPYLHWIMYGKHGNALPHAYQKDNHSLILQRLDRLELFHGSIEDAAKIAGGVDAWNLSDIFEYMSEDYFKKAYGEIVAASNSGSSLVYWNMMAPRSLPKEYFDKVVAQTELADKLAQSDRAFFYSAFHIDEVQ